MKADEIGGVASATARRAAAWREGAQAWPH